MKRGPILKYDPTLTGLEADPLLPRVARSEQPWAERFNPFRIGCGRQSLKSPDDEGGASRGVSLHRRWDSGGYHGAVTTEGEP